MGLSLLDSVQVETYLGTASPPYVADSNTTLRYVNQGEFVNVHEHVWCNGRRSYVCHPAMHPHLRSSLFCSFPVGSSLLPYPNLLMAVQANFQSYVDASYSTAVLIQSAVQTIPIPTLYFPCRDVKLRLYSGSTDACNVPTFSFPSRSTRFEPVTSVEMTTTCAMGIMVTLNLYCERKLALRQPILFRCWLMCCCRVPVPGCHLSRRLHPVQLGTADLDHRRHLPGCPAPPNRGLDHRAAVFPPPICARGRQC